MRNFPSRASQYILILLFSYQEQSDQNCFYCLTRRVVPSEQIKSSSNLSTGQSGHSVLGALCLLFSLTSNGQSAHICFLCPLPCLFACKNNVSGDPRPINNYFNLPLALFSHTRFLKIRIPLHLGLHVCCYFIRETIFKMVGCL